MEKARNRALNILVGLAVTFLLLNHGRELVAILTPIVLAVLLTLLLLPLVDFLAKKIKSRLAATLIVLLPAFALIAAIIWWAINRLYREAEGFVRVAPTLVPTLERLFNERILPLVQGTRYEETFFVILDDVIMRGIESMQAFAMSLISSGISFITSLPGLFVALMVTLLLVFYLTYDKKWVFALIPEASESIDKVIKSIHGYIKTQFFVVTITAGICMGAFALMGIPYVLVLGGLIAIFDVLPILGAGTLLVPMVIWHFWLGQPVRAILLALLYVFIVVVRQVVEPRLLSHNLGIHPIVAIISVFLGLKLFGPIGLIILPLTASIAGSFPRFRWLRR